MCIFNKEDPQEVLASWLFMQFMLTDAVQIAYSQTEGYVPVTTKAQESDTYQDYIARSGQDNALYYDVKLDATKLLLNNTENTFVTPVFNGSASLRNAAGQLVENTTKAIRRGEKLSIRNLYKEVRSLYRLDQIVSSNGGENFGALPTESVALLGGLAACWLGMGVYVAVQKVKKKH